MRSAASKVMWVGRAAVFLMGLAVILSLIFGVASTALSATGGTFILGKANGADRVSKLTASIAGPALTLVNQSTDAAATALNISVASGKAPLKVNAAAGTATNLSADELDGKDSSAFLAANAKAQDAAHADQADSATSAADANTLDNKDSSEFLGKTEKAADADAVDGRDSSAFAVANDVHAPELVAITVGAGPGEGNRSQTLIDDGAFKVIATCNRIAVGPGDYRPEASLWVETTVGNTQMASSGGGTTQPFGPGRSALAAAMTNDSYTDIFQVFEPSGQALHGQYTVQAVNINDSPTNLDSCRFAVSALG